MSRGGIFVGMVCFWGIFACPPSPSRGFFGGSISDPSPLLFCPFSLLYFLHLSSIHPLCKDFDVSHSFFDTRRKDAIDSLYGRKKRSQNLRMTTFCHQNERINTKRSNLHFVHVETRVQTFSNEGRTSSSSSLKRRLQRC